MIQKILVILVGLVMSLVGALAPSAQFASRDANHPSGVVDDVANAADAVLASVRTTDGTAFARIPVLWVEVDGHRVTEDAWGTGELKEVKFKVGVKDVEGIALAVGDKVVPVHPTDTLVIRTFRGDFAYRDITSANAGLQLQGTVKTTSLHAGSPTGKLTTSANGLATPADTRSAQPSDAGRIAFVTLSTGEDLDTVSLQGGGARILTEEPTPSGTPDLGNLLVKWVKLDGKPIREYTWGSGVVDRLEFEPSKVENSSVMLKFRDGAADAAPGAHVLVKDFVGEYLIYQVSDQLLRIRLDGYAGDLTTGVGLAGAGAPGIQQGAAPIAQFESSPLVLHTTDVLTLKDRSSDDGIIVFWKWDFGDGVSSVLQDATHRFSKPGVFNVTLSVTDDDLNTATTVRTIVVNNADPVPDFEFNPRVVSTDTLVGFTDHSIDTDGLVSAWSWDFGDGTTSTMRHPSHRFEASGESTVTLTVTDELGGRASLVKKLLVHNTPPVASFVVSERSPTSANPVQFTSTSTDKDGRIVDWAWNFGDDARNPVKAQAHGPDAFHEYRGPGAYVVRLTVTDNAGDISVAQLSLTVLNQLPVAEFVWSPSDAHTHDPVVFTSTSTDPDPNGFILAHFWDFGDGTNTSISHAAGFQNGGPTTQTYPEEGRDDVHNDTGSPDASRSPAPYAPPPPVMHRFAHPGPFDVRLCVRDNTVADLVCTTHTLTILNAPPNPGPIDVSKESSEDVIVRGENLTLTDRSSDPEGDEIVFREWEFGDGTPDVSGSGEVMVPHRYFQVGTYLVNLTVRDSNGASATTQRAIPIGLARPSASVHADDLHPGVNQVVHFFGNATDRDNPTGPFTYLWTFGDGNTSTAKDPAHAFATPDPFTVTLVVTDPDMQSSNSGDVSLRIDVDFSLPVPDFSWAPVTVTEGEPLSFTDLSTTPNGDITGRSWSWGDGTPANVGNDSAPSHTFAACPRSAAAPPWGFDVRLKVTDQHFTSMGSANLPSVVKHVLVNCKPSAEFAIVDALPAAQGQPIGFIDASADPENGELWRHWDWGDATSTDTTSPEGVSHAWTAPGDHLVTLTTTDDHGATASLAKMVRIIDRAPFAGFAWSPKPAVANNPVQFTSTGLARDPDGNDTLSQWQWDFGDGSPLLIGSGPAFADPQHTYARSGLYWVRLVVGDGTLSSSPNEPGALGFVRVGADHPFDVNVRGILPYGADQDLSIGEVDINLMVSAISPIVQLHKSDLHYDAQGGHFTVPAGVWGEGDVLQVNFRDARIPGAFSPNAIVSLGDSVGVAGPVAMTFQIPLPMANAIDVTPGTAGPIVPLFEGSETPDGSAIYHTTSESFNGGGHVEYVDGHDANGALVDVYIRLVTSLTTTQTNVQNSLPDTVALGWCKVGTVVADLQGDYAWTAPRDTGCPLLNLPVAHYEVRSLSRHMAAPPATSAPRDVFVDPTGLIASFMLP